MTTTIDDALTVETGTPVAEVPAAAVTPTRRPRIWLRLLTGFVLGLALVVALSGAALFAADASYEGRVLPGVRVGSTDLSGMDREQATAALETAYAGYGAGRLIVRTTAGRRDRSLRGHRPGGARRRDGRRRAWRPVAAGPRWNGPSARCAWRRQDARWSRG